MKHTLLGVLLLTLSGALWQIPARTYPVPVILNTLAIEEENHFIQTGEYTEVENLPDGKISRERIKAANYEFFYALLYHNNKADQFHFQAWKGNDCPNGGLRSYYIQQKDSLRSRCSTELLANETDEKVQ
jgi:hypothetical protein